MRCKGTFKGLDHDTDDHRTIYWRKPILLRQTISGLAEVGSERDAFGHAERPDAWVGVCPDKGQNAGTRATPGSETG